MSGEKCQGSKNILLIGFMGSGKTAISKCLQRKYRRNIIDIDEEIVKREKRTIPEIFERDGEAYFRDTETTILGELEARTNLVVSCGGGAVLREENVEIMKRSGIVVYLVATPETVYERVKDCKSRPLLKENNNVEFITRLMEKRRSNYESAADIVIQTDDKSIEQICEELMKKLFE